MRLFIPVLVLATAFVVPQVRASTPGFDIQTLGVPVQARSIDTALDADSSPDVTVSQNN
ncbi:MAG: hypothetical protein AAFX00_13335 [Pseudomonadota bacterium]